MAQEESTKTREGGRVKLKCVGVRLCQHWLWKPLCVSSDWPDAHNLSGCCFFGGVFFILIWLLFNIGFV